MCPGKWVICTIETLLIHILFYDKILFLYTRGLMLKRHAFVSNSTNVCLKGNHSIVTQVLNDEKHIFTESV